MRLLLQVGVTAVLARLLAPDAFGVAAIIISIVTFLRHGSGNAIRRRTCSEKAFATRGNRRHLRVCRTVRDCRLFLAACLVGVGLAWWFERSDFLYLLPFTALLLFAHGPACLATALARRRNDFFTINAAHLISNIVGAIVAILCGYLGAGVWSLLILRVTTIYVRTPYTFWFASIPY